MNPQTPDPANDFLQQKEVNIRQGISHNATWIFISRWSVRAIGIGSTVILARVLAPEDFGLVAICLVLIGFAETIGREAQNLAVIRNQNLDREFMDSAWTLAIIVAFVLGAGIFAAAPLVAHYFNEPRAELLIQILSLRVFLMGFENIGVALYIKDFEFSKTFSYAILEKLVPAVITITLALWMRNYWALVVGAVLGHAIAICISFVAHAYRPKLCFTKIREVWSFSSWVLLEKLAIFGTTRIDYFFIPAFGKATEIGHYHVGTELARMPTGELFSVLDRALFPAYARLIDQPKELANAFINVLSVAAVICLPVSIGFSLVARDTTLLLYGAQWIPMIPIVEVISIASGVAALITVATLTLQAIGKSRISATITGLQLVLLFVVLLSFSKNFDSTMDIANVRLLTTLALLPIALLCVQRILSVSFAETAKAFWRPLAAVSAMAYVLLFVFPSDMDLPVAARLAFRSLVGAVVFAGTLLLLWWIVRKPPGPERALMRVIEGRLPGRKVPPLE
jgi:O-antigen/teichoic acid export membrane protein